MLNDLTFPAGSMLTVLQNVEYDIYGDPIDTDVNHEIGPCSIVDTHGSVTEDSDGHAKWVGTVDVQAPPESVIKIGDRLQLPNGEKARVVKPPERPTNPFTGWTPFIQFTIASPGYMPARGDDYGVPG